MDSYLLAGRNWLAPRPLMSPDYAEAWYEDLSDAENLDDPHIKSYFFGAQVQSFSCIDQAIEFFHGSGMETVPKAYRAYVEAQTINTDRTESRFKAMHALNKYINVGFTDVPTMELLRNPEGLVARFRNLLKADDLKRSSQKCYESYLNGFVAWVVGCAGVPDSFVVFPYPPTIGSPPLTLEQTSTLLTLLNKQGRSKEELLCRVALALPPGAASASTIFNLDRSSLVVGDHHNNDVHIEVNGKQFSISKKLYHRLKAILKGDASFFRSNSGPVLSVKMLNARLQEYRRALRFRGLLSLLTLQRTGEVLRRSYGAHPLSNC